MRTSCPSDLGFAQFYKVTILFNLMLSSSHIANHRGKPLVMVTAYDVCFASIAESAGVDIILVGDSLANVMLGKNRTSELKTETMLLFVEAVANGAKDTHIVADMPYLSYNTVDDALRNAKSYMEAGAHSVKLEGLKPEIIEALIGENIPVMGHLGLLPQTATSLKQVGANNKSAEQIFEEAKALESLGTYAMVLEHMDFQLGKKITHSLNIPTIGIGAGPDTSGQVLVMHDLLGLRKKKLPPFAKKFGNLFEAAQEAFMNYAAAVREGSFPKANQ